MIVHADMGTRLTSAKGFTLIELLVTVAIIGILAALLLPVLSAAKNRARRTTCLNNLRQINVGIRLYSDEWSDKLPSVRSQQTNAILYAYKKLIRSYVGGGSVPSPQDELFACPSDTFYYGSDGRGDVSFELTSQHVQGWSDNSSYAFNGNQFTNLPQHQVAAVLGISGRKASSIKHPANTILVAEGPALDPYSWHEPKLPIGDPKSGLFTNAMDMVSFVDGHVSYIKMYWDGKSLSLAYNPPAGYDYQRSGD